MTEDRIARARTVLRFLNGEGPLDGQWFNERPRGAGPYWWRKHLADVTAALASLPDDVSEDPWQPIETAPKDGTEILLYGPGVLLSDGRTSMYARAQHVGWAHEVDGHLEWATRDPSVTCRPTHWRPLPSPPSAMLAAAGGRDAE